MVNKNVLIQGKVTYTLRVSTLVDEKTAKDEEKVKELLESIGDSEWESNADCEVEYDNEVPVLMDEEMSEKYIKESIGLGTWKEIVAKSKQLKSELK